ncbi:MAG: ABC transporter substrate-binding protein [Anaerolineae bacterium]|nr:ABC transporter substrate-binding protein [Anaerolineae bacterium]
MRLWRMYLVSALLILSVLLGVTSCSTPAAGPAAPTAPPEEKPIITVAMPVDVDHIEYMEYRSDGAYEVTANLYAGLIDQKMVLQENGVLEGTNEFVPNLAEMSVSDDGLLVTLKLREDAKFANGDAITAEDVMYTFERAWAMPWTAGNFPFMNISGTDSMVVVDEHTVEINLENPSTLLPWLLSWQDGLVLDKSDLEAHATEEDPWAVEYAHSNINASGPYQIESWEPGVELRFTPNPYYFRGPEFYQNSGVVVRIVPSAEDRELLLRKGDVDITWQLPLRDLESLEQDPNIKVVSVPSRELVYMFLNLDMPPFDNQLVRQAIASAVPYDDIIEKVMYGHAQKTGSVFSTKMIYYTDEYWQYDYDPERARELLAEAGYADGFSAELAVRLSVARDVDAAVWIQNSLRDVGIDLTVNQMGDAQYYDLLYSRQLSMGINSWLSWADDGFWTVKWLLDCDEFLNSGNYCNTEVDQLIDQAISLWDSPEREQVSRRTQEILVEELPLVPLYQPDWVMCTQSDVYGLTHLGDEQPRWAYLGKEAE